MASIKVPPLGESIVEATVSRWLKKDGDVIAVGDTLVELETDKITVEVPALEAGVLTVRLRQEGDVVTVGDSLGEVGAGAAAGSPTDAVAAPSGSEPVAPEATATASAPVAPVPASASTEFGVTESGTTESGIKVSPAAHRLATEAAIDVAGVVGTGRGGVVAKADVIAAIATPKPATPAAPLPAVSVPPVVGVSHAVRETREKLTTRRKRIAENLLQSQHMTAHLTTFNEIDMTAISALRERLKERVEKEQGLKLSYMPFFAKAASHALQSYPLVNAQLDGDTVVYKHYVNMGIAVASDAGLVVPNIKDIHTKSVVEIGKDIGAVAKRARDGKLSMDDLTGGTFTITNGGVFGSLLSTPIINYPQVAILGLHKIQDRPVAIAGKVEIRPMMYIALSYDHRLIDGQQAVLFLVRVKELMEDPAAMLL